MKRIIYIEVNDDIDGAVTLLPQEAVQIIQNVLEYGELIGKTSIRTEGIGYDINRAINHANAFDTDTLYGATDESKFEHISHFATRATIALQKYIEKEKERKSRRQHEHCM